MKTVFADTSYYLALLHTDDARHMEAIGFSREASLRTVTTAWVLTEVANALSRASYRNAFVTMFQSLRFNPFVSIIPPSQEVFDLGLDLYAQRPDKDWSLTDCISFIVMQRHGLTDALTGDRHFQQAGFKALLAHEE